MMATQAEAGLARRWPRLAVVLVAVLIAVALVAVYFALKPPPAPTATSPLLTPPVSSATPPASVTGAPTALADGCLGGTDPIKAIRIARKTAPLTPEGAAAFVATLARWAGQVPHDPTEYQQTGELIWAPDFPATQRTLPPFSAGTTAWTSTIGSRYRVPVVSDRGATVEAFFTQTANQDGATSTNGQVARVQLTVVDGRWAVKDASPPGDRSEQLLNELQAKGLPYRGGC